MKTYGRMTLSEDRKTWVVESLEPHVSIRFKQIFPGVPKSTVPPYRLPHNMPTDADLEWFTQRYPLDVPPFDRMMLEQGRASFLQRQAEMESILLPDYKPTGTAKLKEAQVIRPYQWQAIELLRRRGKLLLGDEVGLGKTYTAAGFLVAEPASLPAAVVCDAHMQGQWKEKIEAFTHLRVHKIKKTSPYSLPEADVYIFRISQVAGWVDIFKSNHFQAAIYDEPQSLRTGATTAKGRACKVLSAHTTFHCGLTATPIFNYGDEMWHVMQFIDPEVLSTQNDFTLEWCTAAGIGKWRVKNPKALGAYLREQYVMLRRTKTDVGQQLPKVSRVIEHIDYDQKAVDSVEELARILAIKATTASFVERGMASRELDVMVRQATGVAKAKTVAAFVKMMVEGGEPVVLFGWHRAVYETWLEELKDLKPVMYTGSESVPQKEEAKRRFVSGETDVLIMSLRSGAGLDGLQGRCNTAVFGELDWSPGVHHQCIGRLDREGQTQPVTAFYLVTDDGSDPPMMDVLGIKASEAHHILDPNAAVEIIPDDTSHLRRLVERYLSRKKEVAA